ncbi:MAG: protein kinase domain-containing protein [Acidimicrobiales bacterium]
MPAGQSVDLGIPGTTDAVEIGRGGFAVVYRAMQPAFERYVAVKIFGNLTVDDATREAFQRECRAIGRIAGRPNVLAVHEAGMTAKGRPFLVMAFMAQGSLQDELDRTGPFPWPRAVDIGIKLASALDLAHRSSVLHRDVKPDNILISDDGEPQLADFGIARLTNVTRLARSSLAFTPAHVPPEVAAGQPATAVGDVYSLASTLFMLIAGRAAFVERPEDTLFTVMNRVSTAPVPNLLRPRRVPEAVCAAIERTMAKDPALRPTSAAEFAALLEVARADALRQEAVQEEAKRTRPSQPPPIAATTPQQAPSAVGVPRSPAEPDRPTARGGGIMPGGGISSRPLHFIILADRSGSMKGEKIQSLNFAVADMMNHLQDWERDQESAKLYIRAVAFGDEVTWHVETPTPVSELRWQPLIPEGRTRMGLALKTVAEVLTPQRLERRALRPALLLITDGKPTDDFDEGLAALFSTPAGRSALRLGLAIGHGADESVLNRFIGDRNVPVLHADSAEEITARLVAVSIAISRMSEVGADRAAIARRVLGPADATSRAGDDLIL